MTDAAAGSVLGDDCKLYYSATLGGAGTLTEVPVVIDDTLNSERRAVESNCRGDAEIGELIGKPKHTITGTILLKRDSAGVGSTFVALRDAYTAGTVLHFAMATGDITHIGQYVFRLEGTLKRWEQSQPDNDTVKVSFEITHAGNNTYASNFSTVTS